MYHSKKYLIVIIFFLSFVCFYGQEDTIVRENNDAIVNPSESTNNINIINESDLSGPMDEDKVEKISYQLYLNKQWLQLAKYGERAVKLNFDYYYLRVRLGAAFFELGQYRKAIIHFKRALEFNTNDDFANSYLYYAYIYSERFEDAKNLTRSFSANLAKSLYVKSLSPVDFIAMESGIKAPDSTRQFKNALFTDVSINHSISNRVFLLHSLTYFSQNEERFSVRQMQYYLKGTLPLKNGFLISAGVHLVNVNADVRSILTTINTNTVSVNPITPNGGLAPPQVVSFTTVAHSEQITNKVTLSYVTAFTLIKRTLFADYSIGATLASFDTTRQFQLNLGINIYPFKNNRLALGAAAYVHSEKPFEQSNIAIAPTLSFYLTKKVHLLAAYLNNTGPNISENTGSFVSNSVDYTTQRTSITASFNVANNLWIYGTYGYEQKKHLTAGYTYDYNIFVIGFKVIPQYK